MLAPSQGATGTMVGLELDQMGGHGAKMLKCCGFVILAESGWIALLARLGLSLNDGQVTLPAPPAQTPRRPMLTVGLMLKTLLLIRC